MGLHSTTEPHPAESLGVFSGDFSCSFFSFWLTFYVCSYELDKIGVSSSLGELAYVEVASVEAVCAWWSAACWESMGGKGIGVTGLQNPQQLRWRGRCG